MTATVATVAYLGLEARPVEVQVQLSAGLPRFTIVGLPDKAVAESRERVQPGTYVQMGGKIGHPSCEGGLSNATHLHIARRYNGEWIPADGNVPFVMDGWVSSGNGVEYDGFLKKGAATIEAWEGVHEGVNQISR